MVILPLRDNWKCYRRRRVFHTVHYSDHQVVTSLLLILAGDVETNPGPGESNVHVEKPRRAHFKLFATSFSYMIIINVEWNLYYGMITYRLLLGRVKQAPH